MEYAARLSGTDPSTELGQQEPVARHGTAIGLARARAHLHQVLHDARAGRSGVTAVHGLAGSGKTSLLDSALRHTQDFTRVTLPVPADCVPLELWQRLFVLDSTGSIESERLRQAARSAIRASAEVRDAPVLVIFDECPASHLPVAQAIAAAVLDPGLDVVAAFALAWRDEVDGSTSPLQFELPAHRLEPLTEAQSAELLKRRTGKSFDPAVLADIWRATGGNPSGLVSSSSRLSEDELDGLVPLPTPIPLGLELADSFGAWVEELGHDARLAVTVAAAADVPRAVLEEALSQVDLTLNALHPARSLGVLSIGADRVRFIHPLCRAAAFRLGTYDSTRLARHAMTDALVSAGMVEQAATVSATSATARDEELMSLCVMASRAGSERSDHQSAARFLVLASRYAPTDERAARLLIDASSIWHAAGRPDRARLCLQRVAPDNVTDAIIGQATYHSARQTFSLCASPHSSAQMAAGAEACGETEPETASTLMADAAASAVLIDAFDEALTYAQRAVDLAEERPGARRWALLARDAVSTSVSGPGTLEKSALRDSIDSLTCSGRDFPGSPQLAYVLGNALIHVATPTQMNRWLTWMDDVVHVSEDPGLAAVVSLSRSHARLYAGNVPQAVDQADFAVTQLSEVHDITLLARALAWSAWVHAGAGQTTKALEAAARFFALEQASLQLPHVQVLSSLAHCELQKGRVRSAHAWLRAMEHDCDDRSWRRSRFDWPARQVYFHLARLSHYELERPGTTAPVAPRAEQLFPTASTANEGVDAAVRGPLETGPVSAWHSPFVNAHLTLVAALRQSRLGRTELASFNFSRAEAAFDECGAIGWSRLVARLGVRGRI